MTPGLVHVLDYRAPTRAELLRHLERFGDAEAVYEVAAWYGIDLGADGTAAIVAQARNAKAPKRAAVEAGVSKFRRTSPELVAQVLELHGRGMRKAPIADALNLPERRVARIIREHKPGTSKTAPETRMATGENVQVTALGDSRPGGAPRAA